MSAAVPGPGGSSPAAPKLEAAVAAIGAFDGVHRGHQALLADVVARARELGARSVCVTFDPDPERVLRPEMRPRALGTIADRARLVRELGVDEVYVWPFTPAVAQMTPAEFVAALAARYPLAEVWVGADFRFGHDRAGTTSTLAVLGRRHGFTVRPVEPVFDGAQPISSTRIRDLLESGEVAEAARLLGRPYRLAGEVIGGAQRGRQLGFPTANLLPPAGQALPSEGVYAGRAHVEGAAHPAVANLGSRPTFGEDQPLLEVHLLDYAGDLYGRQLALDLIDRVRPTRRFESLDALRAQIAADITTARALLGALKD
jgi:riboflavin kinase / FMN adenylyltransferase